MKKNRSRFLLLALLAGAIALFVIFDVKQYLSLDYLKSQQEAFKAYYSAHHFLTLFLFFMLYVVVTTLSLPGAAILTMASGVLFGLGLGIVIASFASSIGATLAFLASRFFLQDYVQEKFGDKLKSVLKGFKKEGEFYLFTLRLIPFFPFVRPLSSKS
jgi:uncharacterized membrane protein YdjX (TVP38/TMEM64 family)